jgi:hypothetical protein
MTDEHVGVNNHTSHTAVQILQTSCCDYKAYLCCCGITRSSTRMIHLMNSLRDLTPFQRNALINRYVSITENIRRRACIWAWVFHIGRTIVTVGSLIVPALLSIQYADTGGVNSQYISIQIYWLTWFVSLLVTTCNGILTLFKVDKKYYFLHTTLEQLKSEAYQYIHLSGKYSGHFLKGLVQPTHGNQYVYFCHSIEKIKLKQVEEEYYKLAEPSQTTEGEKQVTANDSSKGGVVDGKKIAGLYIPTPDPSQLISAQQELARALSIAQVDGGRDGSAAPKNTLIPKESSGTATTTK